MANEAAEAAKGEVVFVDVADKHSSMLNRQIRLVYTDEFKISRLSSIYGLLCGMISANRDVEKIFVDGLDKIVANQYEGQLLEFLELLEVFSKNNDVDIICTASLEDSQLLEDTKKFQ